MRSQISFRRLDIKSEAHRIILNQTIAAAKPGISFNSHALDNNLVRFISRYTKAAHVAEIAPPAVPVCISQQKSNNYGSKPPMLI